MGLSLNTPGIDIRALDVRAYGRLLAKTTPQVISSAQELRRAEDLIESLMEKGEARMTPEEDALLDLLTNLIRDYERSTRPVRPRSSPGEMVAFLMEQRSLAPKDLLAVLGSRSRVSEILTGKRAVSKEQAKKLAAFFHTPADLFL